MYVDCSLNGNRAYGTTAARRGRGRVKAGIHKPADNKKALSSCKSRPVRCGGAMSGATTKKPVYPGMTVLGLTGSIGMGKSTVGKMFVKHGVPVLDADQIVHDLYAVGGAAVPLLESEFPGTAVEGAIWRPKLSTYVVGSEEAMRKLEAIVHPLVAAERDKRLNRLAQEGSVRLVVVDIPLLYETNCQNQVDAVVVVSAPAEVQRERVLLRPAMTPQKLDAILGRQMPDEQKRKLADYLIDTGVSLEETEAQVVDLLSRLKQS